MHYKISLMLSPQPEGGFTVTSPLVPELITEGDTVEEAMANAKDALTAVLEFYEETGRTLPASVQLPETGDPVWLEMVVPA